MQARVGDKVKVLVDTYGNQYTDTQYYFGPRKGDVIDVVEKCRSNGYWIDSTSVDLDCVNSACYQGQFELIPTEEDYTQKKFSVESVKSKFSVGDKVISVKNTPNTQEGFIGVITDIAEDYIHPIRVVNSNDSSELFTEDELELLVRQEEHSINLVPKDRGYITPEGVEVKSQSALDKQVSGSHYKDFKIQPAEYCHANNIPFLEGNVIKYTSRHKAKNGKKDLEKAIHCLELLIELEYKE